MKLIKVGLIWLIWAAITLGLAYSKAPLTPDDVTVVVILGIVGCVLLTF